MHLGCDRTWWHGISLKIGLGYMCMYPSMHAWICTYIYNTHIHTIIEVRNIKERDTKTCMHNCNSTLHNVYYAKH